MAKRSKKDLFAIRRGSKGDIFIGNLDDVPIGGELPKDVLLVFETKADADARLLLMPSARP